MNKILKPKPKRYILKKQDLPTQFQHKMQKFETPQTQVPQKM